MSAMSSQKRSARTSIERVLEEVNNQDSDYEEENNKSDLYVVEKILGKKRYKGVLKYKVKWEGYPESQCTWEPVDHLTNVPDLIEAFEKQRKPVKSRNREDKENDPDEQGEDKPKQRKPRQRTKKVKTDSDPKKASKDSDIKLKKREPEKEEKPKVYSDDIEEESPKEPEKKPEKKSLTKIIEKALGQSLPVYGHFKYGDKPKKILNARQDGDTVIFTIGWEPRKNGDIPTNTEMIAAEIKTYDKDMLLDYYEKRIKFVRSSSTKVKQEYVEEQPIYMKTPEGKGQIEEEFERSGEKDKQDKKSVEKPRAEVDDKGSVRKLFDMAQQGVLESGKRVKVIGSVGKRSVATTRFDDDGFFSEFKTPGHFRETLEQEIAGNQIK